MLFSLSPIAIGALALIFALCLFPMSATEKLAAFRHAFALLRRNDPLILASATAFFTTFSLPPIIIIIVSVLGIYFKSEHIRQQIFDKLTSMLGGAATGEIEKIVHNFMKLEGNAWVTAGGFLFLLFVATTLLSIIRKAIHQLWHIRRKSSKKLYYSVKERILGLGMLFFIGLLFLASTLLDASVSLFRNYLHDIFPDVDAIVIRILNIVFSILVVTIWFTVLFKMLPEARVKWRVAFAGGLLTGLLFSIGKLILRLMLVESNLVTIYGASASIALLLLFIFYSSMIVYYGAAFTHAFGKAIGCPIHAGRYGIEYEERVLETEKPA